MKSHRKIHRLALGVVVISVLAAFAVSPILAQASGGAAGSRHAKASVHKKKRAHRRAHRRARLSAARLSAAAGNATATAGVGAALKPSGGGSGPSSGCPSANTLANFQVADNVGASFVNGGTTTTTYTFISFEDEKPVGGVPGLVKYCVYPKPLTAPTAATALAKGANNATWMSRKDSGGFAFVRPGGDKSNIPLDGETTKMGTATWSTAPEAQTILLHINDPRVCTRLYGAEAPGTCFVKPGEPQGPVCDAGLTDIAYSSMPLDIFNGCPPRASMAFEAQQTSEFGDEVKLAGSGDLKSLIVTFMSYGCGDEGHWNLGTSDPCKTTPGEKFETEITGRVYEVATGDTVGKELTKMSKTFSIPYRPSAEPTECPESGTEWEAGSKFRDPVSGLCLLALPLPIEFTFPTGVEAPESGKVIWTVAFNTTHYGYNPIGESAGCFKTDPGCGYDSLNVGTWSFEGAPYSGEDVNAETVFWAGAPSNVLGAIGPGWAKYKPLAEIRLEP